MTFPQRRLGPLPEPFKLEHWTHLGDDREGPLEHERRARLGKPCGADPS